MLALAPRWPFASAVAIPFAAPFANTYDKRFAKQPQRIQHRAGVDMTSEGLCERFCVCLSKLFCEVQYKRSYMIYHIRCILAPRSGYIIVFVYVYVCVYVYVIARVMFMFAL